jgi:hypothetical protein
MKEIFKSGREKSEKEYYLSGEAILSVMGR